MKSFYIIRHKDESGVSGTGKVLQGVEFNNGVIVICWLAPPHSLGIYTNFASFKKVHIDSHPTNETEIVWE